MPIIELENLELYYEIHGTGTPVLLVSGLGGTGSYWNPNVGEFAEHFRVIIHDHRGTGLSSKSKIKYSVEQMTNDLIKLMDALEIDKAHLVGHSTGGAMGQIIGVTNPDRLLSLVIYSSWTCATPFMRRCFEIRRELLLKSGVEAYVKAVPIFLHAPWWFNENFEKLEQMEEEIIKTSSDIDILAGRIDGILDFNGRKYLEKKLDIPTLVCCAKDDILTPKHFSDEIAESIPGCETYWFEKGGHAVSQALPQEFNRVIISFLKSQEKKN